jgi:hypothetical protein
LLNALQSAFHDLKSRAFGFMEASAEQPHPHQTRRLAIICGCQWAADLFLLALEGTGIHPELVDELLRHHQEMIEFGLIDPQLDLRAYATGRVSAAIQQARILGDLPRTRSRITLRLDEDGAIDVLPIDQG